jgi:crotonobetainyl-CoA:carnitine CoA-transferase CaiB-like acyl-CoA transferase
MYESSDGWFFLGLRAGETARLTSVTGLKGVDGLDETSLESFLDQRFLDATSATWVERLRAANVGAHAVLSLDVLMDDPVVRSRNLIVSREHEGVGVVEQVGTIPRLSRTPTRVGAPASAPGARTSEVLRDHGLLAQAAHLISVGAITVAE